jgi:hypothetical protein
MMLGEQVSNLGSVGDGKSIYLLKPRLGLRNRQQIGNDATLHRSDSGPAIM